jgi:multidrug efflux system membrane fusion protein
VATHEAQVGTQEGLVEADTAQIDSAQVSLSYTTIRSPITGKTGIRQVDIGNIVHTTDCTPIVVVTQLQPISVLFTLPEQDLSAIQDLQTAQASPLTVMALDGQSGKVIDRGTLQLVDNEIDQTTGTIKLKANFPNPKNRLWPGEFVTARLVLDIRHNRIVLPAKAIQNGPNGTFVFAIASGNKAIVQSVKMARIEHGIALIDQGIQPGQHVVLDGQLRLQPGTQVTVVPPSSSTR